MAGLKLSVMLVLVLLLPCCTSGKNGKRLTAADKSQEVAKHAIKIHQGKEPSIRGIAGEAGNQTSREVITLDSYLSNSCQVLANLKQTKKLVIQKLDRTIVDVHLDQNVEKAEKMFRIHMFEIFKRELNESEDAILMSINGLKRALQPTAGPALSTANRFAALAMEDVDPIIIDDSIDGPRRSC
ncbi:transmembrane and coiled-coil domain-containing protein 3-like [Patiria miniata]|uniref:Uncharacterized protein n=1 Tax=Patiria miniata TaxID=46514 RepID=A0A913ZHV7_PATMI|nr:transmembrane and coiled-coil domain-containing protein 3-like [Patiria miniata]